MANGFNVKNEGQIHVQLRGLTALAAAVSKGDTVIIGGRLALYDDDYAKDVTEVSVGMLGQYQFALADVDGASASTVAGTIVYADSSGALTLTATSNTAIGFVTFADNSTIWIKGV
jgi:hypothetical protein